MKLNKVLYAACFLSLFLTFVNTVNAMAPEAMPPRLPKFECASGKMNAILTRYTESSRVELFKEHLPVNDLNDITVILKTNEEIMQFSYDPSISVYEKAQMRKIADLLIAYLRNELFSNQEQFTKLFQESEAFWQNLSDEQRAIIETFYKRQSRQEDLYGPIPFDAMATMALVMGCSLATTFYIFNFVIGKFQVSTSFIE